ncbi:MAG: hypothetical protein GIW98_01825 [Candidatus Eremiobacteraeota bacterium]|nr:hypothetical protein [Candidatus Eremiobacteraeota bacterium]
MMMKNSSRLALSSVLPLVLALGISACGGGGGSSSGGGGVPPVTGRGAPIILVNGLILGQDDTFSPIDGDAATTATIDGIPCGSEIVNFHVHAHLSIIVNGNRVAVPDAIGIHNPRPEQNNFVASGGCLYYLHTHDASGVIHMEAPGAMSFTLGQLFDIWGQPLSMTNVAGKTGSVQVYTAANPGAYVPYSGDIRALPIQRHEDILLEVGPAFVNPQSLPLIIFPTGL